MLGAMSFGFGSWGFFPWGFGSGGLALVSAMAIRENVVRLSFSEGVRFTELLDLGDGSDPRLYRVTVQDSTGMDGEPARAVNVAQVARVAGDPSLIDVYVDRSFSPFPSVYKVEVFGLVSLSGDHLGPDDEIDFYGVAQAIVPNKPQLAIPHRDIASPNDLKSMLDTIPDIIGTKLGVLAYDAGGDYASDRGNTSYKQRIFRRVFTRPNGFMHLIGYGVGLLQRVKTLFRAREQEALAADAEAQIFEEPETQDVSVTFTQDASNPHLYFMRIRARSKTGEAVDESLPFDIGGG